MRPKNTDIWLSSLQDFGYVQVTSTENLKAFVCNQPVVVPTSEPIWQCTGGTVVRKIEVHTMYSLPVMFFFRHIGKGTCFSPMWVILQPCVQVVDNKKQHFQIQIRTGNGEWRAILWMYHWNFYLFRLLFIYKTGS